MTWFSSQDEINDSIARGDLELAIEQFQQRREQASAQPSELVRWRQRITAALMDRANAALANQNLVAAWKDLTQAGELAVPSDLDAVSKQKNQLVELTIETADALLLDSKASHAMQLVNELRGRQILDWRVDRIHEVAQCLQQAEHFEAAGKIQEAIEQLKVAQQLRPEISQLQARIDCKRQREIDLKKLTDQLQKAALSCHWIEVNEICTRILRVAPKHEIAAAAKKHSLKRMKRQTSAGSRITNVPERITDSNSFFQFNRSPDESIQDVRAPQLAAAGSAPHSHPIPAQRDLAEADSFLLWVDGVGGYLVIPHSVCLIGQATDDTQVAIPLQADLRKRHVRLELISGQHLVQPLGQVTVDGLERSTAFVLNSGQTLGLGNGVRLRYWQTHPLSKSSRLDFVSRHRTQPWSDGVILASQSIVLGANRNNHVFCPRWRSEIILFCRQETWFCRRRKPFQVDGQTYSHEAEIRFDSHISGDDFSLTLEPVFKPKTESRET